MVFDREALREAISQELERDPSVFVIGEDVGKIGGIFGVTRGLAERFGRDRLRDTPISEQAIAAHAVGAAISGLRPIVEIQIFDFVTLMMDMIVNQSAKFRFMLGGTPKVPIVFRGPQGGGIRLAAQHSQSLEAWFTHIPGLVVLAPASPYEAKGLLTAAIRDDNPVEVIDPRTLRPLDEATIIASVRKTSRLVIAHEGWKHGGFGAEVSAQGNGAILLVESRAGLESIEAICALPGLKCLMIGPFDLAVSLGFRGDYLHLEVQRAIDRMIAAAAADANRVPLMVPVFAADLAVARSQMAAWRARGVRLFVVGTDKPTCNALIPSTHCARSTDVGSSHSRVTAGACARNSGRP